MGVGVDLQSIPVIVTCVDNGQPVVDKEALEIVEAILVPRRNGVALEPPGEIVGALE
jgi:hypothetical protein